MEQVELAGMAYIRLVHETRSVFCACAPPSIVYLRARALIDDIHKLFLLLQVKKPSFLFKLEPTTVFLVEEIDNTAIFPKDTGCFGTSQISPGMIYEVHGEPAVKCQPPHSATSA